MHKYVYEIIFAAQLKITDIVHVYSSAQCIHTARLSWHKFITQVTTKYQYPISNALGNELISP